MNSTYELIADSIKHSQTAKRWYAVVYYHQEKVEFRQVYSDEILLLLFSNLQGEASFITSDKFPPGMCGMNLKVDEYEADLQKMTNEQFLTQFIADLTDERNVNAKKNLRAFAGRLALTLLGINFLVNGILHRVPVPIVLGILQICAYACLVCSLVFNLSLGLLIPSSIILGLLTIASIVIYSLMYKSANNESVEKLSTAINSMNNELTKARNEQTNIKGKGLLNPGEQIDEVDKGIQPEFKKNDNGLDNEKNNDNI
ncbi:MAG: hypothetical protein IJU86_01805 [Firmicutes bacterium]|nr:hypothetical protein [Bacillota bacterium]